MKYLLDTNALSEVIKKEPNRGPLHRLGEIDPRDAVTSVVCVAELRHGAARVVHGERLWERIAREVLSRVDILPLGSAEALRAGDLLATLEAQGQPIGMEDVWIGATALELRLTASSPSLTVNDIEASMAWYRDVLGFTVGERWESDGKLLGAEMTAGDVVFMIGQDDWKKGRDRVKGVGVRLYCTTNQDIDKLAARITENGGTPDGPKDTPWGTREFAVDDPDGYKITIAKETKKR